MKPCETLDPMEVAFGCVDVKRMKLLPEMKYIPEEFKQDGNPWVKLQQQWFFTGLRGVKFHPKPGIDLGRAMLHLKAIQSSFDPPHEHKKAAVAYLMSLWIDRVERGVPPDGPKPAKRILPKKQPRPEFKVPARRVGGPKRGGL